MEQKYIDAQMEASMKTEHSYLQNTDISVTRELEGHKNIADMADNENSESRTRLDAKDSLLDTKYSVFGTKDGVFGAWEREGRSCLTTNDAEAMFGKGFQIGDKNDVLVSEAELDETVGDSAGKDEENDDVASAKEGTSCINESGILAQRKQIPDITSDKENIKIGKIGAECDFLFGKKKRRIKPRPVQDASQEMVTGTDESAKVDKKKVTNDLENRKEQDQLDDNTDTDLDFLKWKKKPRKPKTGILYDIKPENTADVPMVGEEQGKDNMGDYSYDKMLSFVYTNIKIYNPEIQPGEYKKLLMPDPQVLREGVRKTGFYNFAEICRALHRQPKHVLDYILMEFATSGSVDMRNKVTLIGRFAQKHVQGVLSRYIKEYVKCRTCKSANTILLKSNRLQFLVCESCGSRYTVSQITTGYRAITRRTMRTDRR